MTEVIVTVTVNAKAMPFFGRTLATTYGFAKRFAGNSGRIATLPDIMSARAAVQEDAVSTGTLLNPWHTWFDTATAEYMGYTIGGVPIIIVAHGIGPMATMTGIRRVFRRRDPQLVYGQCTITLDQFRKLEAGAYGDVSIVPLKKVMGCYEVPFHEASTLDQAAADPLLQARLGPAWSQVMIELDRVTRDRELRFTGSQPKLIANLGNNYERQKEARNLPQAHLLTVTRTVEAHRGRDSGGTSISFDVYPADSVSCNRFVGIKPGWDGSGIHAGHRLLDDTGALKWLLTSGEPQKLGTDYDLMMSLFRRLENYHPS